MALGNLLSALADVFDRPVAIEIAARNALQTAPTDPPKQPPAVRLSAPFLAVMGEADAHPVCNLIARTPLPWAPPQTSADPLYQAHSLPKIHVELLGPEGLLPSHQIRLGLYGILPHSDYGIRTHPAEETFVMLAGQAYWKRGDAPYVMQGPGERSHHPSMLPHATRTKDKAFLSAYVWYGDLSTENYRYLGVPA